PVGLKRGPLPPHPGPPSGAILTAGPGGLIPRPFRPLYAASMGRSEDLSRDAPEVPRTHTTPASAAPEDANVRASPNDAPHTPPGCRGRLVGSWAGGVRAAAGPGTYRCWAPNAELGRQSARKGGRGNG